MLLSRTRLGAASLIALFGVTYATGSHADDFNTKKSQSAALDNFSIWLGGYYANNDTTLRAHTNVADSSASLNFEDDLGFRQHKVVPRARFDFLIGAHQGFTVDYYRVDRSHSEAVADGGTVLGQDVSGSAKATGRLNFDFGSVAYKWWFGTGDDVFGLGIGAAHYKVYGKLSGSARINGEGFYDETHGDTQAWAPNLQVGWRHAFNENLRMYINASGVKRNGGDDDSTVHGHIFDAAVGMEWFPGKNVGVGVEYAYTNIDLKQGHHYDGGETLDYNLKMKLNGPAAYLRLRF